MPVYEITWRGWSGRTYRASVRPIAEAMEHGARDGVFLAIKRDKDGIGKLATRPSPRLSQEWIGRARAAGATEIHACDGEAAEQPAHVILDDLKGAA